MLKQQTKLRVRLYARLSKDDGDADKESNSITNQLQMLRYNAKEKGFEVIGEYVDDGYSGTTFNRPDLNRMIKDAMDDPEPSGIMVKDMSRFGRNNAMFMYYVEEIFPNNDILFIALNDDVDTRFDENEMMPFKSIMNEYYARDTSKKIRSVKKTTALSGGFCGSFAPYGYVVDPENKRKLLVDPDTAPIVKRIFELSKQGNSVHQIARTLCEDDVLIPRAYRAMKKGTLETSTGFKFPTDWVAKNVKMILENQVYLGHMVSHKTQTKSFKNKKPVAVPKEEWIIVRNTHEAIIDEETFELVQKFISVKKQPNKTGRPNIFVGLVKCPDCGRNMAFSNPNGREPRFRCRTYVRNSNLCTTHAISYEALQQIVMSDIQKHIKNMEALGDQFIQEMHELSEKGGSKKIKQFEKDLEVAEKRIAEIDSVIMKLFEQNALGKISDERFEKMSSAYESEQKELAQKRDELRTKIRAEEKKTQSTNQFLETIRKYETVTELNRSMLVELIDSIYVYQAEGTGKDRKQRVEINYRFLAGSQCGIAWRKRLKRRRECGIIIETATGRYGKISRRPCGMEAAYFRRITMKAALVIMAAGLGSRYGGNKQVDGVGPQGEMLMEYSIYDAVRAGFTKVVFIIKPDMRELMDRLWGDRTLITKTGEPLEVCYAMQDFTSIPDYYTIPAGRTKPFGTAHAVLCARPYLSEPFCVINADDYYGVDAYRAMYEELQRLPRQGRAAMVGYLLKNTVSANGTVSRGVCRVEDGWLRGIHETLKIQLFPDGSIADVAEGQHRELAPDTVVSMNFWGFMPSVFQELEAYFDHFLRCEAGDNIKAECLLPGMVGDLLEQGRLEVSVLHSADRWFGMTYHEDRQAVAAELQKLHAGGVYPPTLRA